MLTDVVHLEGEGDLATLRARIRLLYEYLLTQAEPAGDTVPAAHVHVGAHGMAGTGATGDENTTTGLSTVLHRNRVKRNLHLFRLFHYVSLRNPTFPPASTSIQQHPTAT